MGLQHSNTRAPPAHALSTASGVLRRRASGYMGITGGLQGDYSGLLQRLGGVWGKIVRAFCGQEAGNWEAEAGEHLHVGGGRGLHPGERVSRAAGTLEDSPGVGTGQAKTMAGSWSRPIGEAGGKRWETRRRNRSDQARRTPPSNPNMRAIWKGSISFGLVSIPIELFPATRREELKFRLLRASDLSPVNYKRVAEADGKEVPWDQIVKGYEYEKGKFVVLKDEDFARVDVEATQTVDIVQFVQLKEIDPLLFYKPYYMEVQKGGDKAYALLRQGLADSGMVAIAKVVIKTRQHLAAVKPQERGLMLELMRFPEELLDVSEFKAPAATTPGKAEINMAKKLIESMSGKWNPEVYRDDYHAVLEKVIEEKARKGGQPPAAPKRPPKTANVIDLVSVLQQSIQDAQRKSRSKPLKKAA